jgi:hypothetical protein
VLPFDVLIAIEYESRRADREKHQVLLIGFDALTRACGDQDDVAGTDFRPLDQGVRVAVGAISTVP